MGWYLRKSISFGGLRLNFSKSGIGFSAGMKGLRFGIGPRGSYIHAGSNGLYCRQSLREKSKIDSNSFESNYSVNNIEIFSDEESSDIILKVKKNRRKFVFFPLAFVFCFIPTVGIGIAFVTAIILYILFDRKIKKVPLLYDFQKGYSDWENALKELTQCSQASYIIDDETTLWQKKVTLQFTPPRDIDTNVTVLQMKIGKTKLYFFPDRLLIYDGRKICGINYRNMLFDHHNLVIPLDGEIPPDGTVVGYTWLHTRQDGFPDKRYSFNPKLPELKYSIISFSSNTGLSEQKIMFSKPDTGRLLVNIINFTFCKTDTGNQKQLRIFLDEKKLEEAKEIIQNEEYVNTSFLQRRLKIGFNQASEIIDLLIEQDELRPYCLGKFFVVNSTICQNYSETNEDINKITPFISEQAPQRFNDQIVAENDESSETEDEDYEKFDDEDVEDIAPILNKYLRPGDDTTMRRALEVVILERKASTRYFQQRLHIGYNQAAELIDQLEERGIIGPPSDGDNKRDILIFDGIDFS